MTCHYKLLAFSPLSWPYAFIIFYPQQHLFYPMVVTLIALSLKGIINHPLVLLRLPSSFLLYFYDLFFWLGKGLFPISFSFLFGQQEAERAVFLFCRGLGTKRF